MGARRLRLGLELVTGLALVVYGVLALASGLAHGQTAVPSPTPVVVAAAPDAASWLAIAQQLVVTVAVPVLVALATWAAAAIRRKSAAQEAAAEGEAEAARIAARAAALRELNALARQAVLVTQAEVVRPARESDADGAPVGRIAPETATRAKADAMSRVGRTLSLPALHAIGADAFADVASAAVEAAVEASKAPAPSAAVPDAEPGGGGI